MINNSGALLLCATFIFILWYTIEYMKKAYEEWLKEKNIHLDQVFIFSAFGTFIFFAYMYVQDTQEMQNRVLTNWLTTITALVTPLIIFFVVIFLFEAIKLLPPFQKEKGGEHFDKDN